MKATASSIFHIFRTFRPVNIAVLVFTQLLVYVTLPEEGCYAYPITHRFPILMLSTIFLAAAGYVINDYFDTKIDVINKPEKVVLGTRISRKYGIAIHVALNLLAVLAGFYLSFRLGLFNMGVAGVLLAYSTTFKKKFLIGNLFIAALMGLVVFVVWLFDQGLRLDLVLFYSAFAFMIGLLREIIKDMEDVEGDRKFGCATMPIVWGIYRSKMVLNWLGIVFLFFLLGFAGYAFQLINLWQPLYMIFLVLLPAVFFLHFLNKADKKEDFSKLSNLLKGIMVLGLLSLLLVCI